MENPKIIILAAGRGTRLSSELPKPLVPLAGTPMLGWLLASIKKGNLKQPIIVLGYKREKIKSYLKNSSIPAKIAIQPKLDGTGGAVRVALKFLPKKGTVVTVCADNPLVSVKTLKKLAALVSAPQTVIALGTAKKSLSDSRGAALIGVRNNIKNVIDLENVANRKNLEYTLGLMAFDISWLRSNIKKIKKSAKGEYKLPDLIGIALTQGKEVKALRVNNLLETASINDPAELRAVEDLLTKKQK